MTRPEVWPIDRLLATRFEHAALFSSAAVLAKATATFRLPCLSRTTIGEASAPLPHSEGTAISRMSGLRA